METVSRTRATIANLIFQYASLLLAITGIVLTPLYLRFIDLKLFGAWLASGNVIGWLAMLNPGLNELLRQQVAKFYGEKNWTMLGRSIGTGWAVVTCSSLLVVFIGLLISRIVPYCFDVEAEHLKELKPCIFLASVSLALVLFSGSPGSVQQALQRSERFLVIYLFGWACGVISTVILLFKGYGLFSIPLGGIVRGTIWSVFSSLDTLYLARRKLGVSIGWSANYLFKIKGLIGATFLKVAGRVMEKSCDAFLVAIFLGVEMVPLVVFSSKLWQVAVQFSERISVAFMPGLAHLWGEGEKSRAVEIGAKVLKVTIWLVAFEVAALLFLNKTFIGLWVGDKFFAGGTFNLLMGFGIITYAYAYASGQVLFAANIIKGPALAWFARGILRVGLLIVLLKVIGIIAVPITMIASSVIILLVYLQKRISLLLNVDLMKLKRTMTIPLLVGTCLGLAGAYLVGTNTWLELVFGAVAIVLINGMVLALVDANFRAFAVSAISEMRLR